MESIWKTNLEIETRKELQKDIEVQNVVIGAGIAGILIAYFLQKKGQKVIVIEAKAIGSGQTGNTTAKITSQHGLCYEKMMRKMNAEKAREYARANEEAIKSFEQVIKDENINCQFEKKPAYLYTQSEENVEVLKKEAAAAAFLGINACYVDGDNITELPFRVKGAVRFENQAQFHPMEFIGHLSKKLEIYENTRVLSVKKHMICTDKGMITAENIIFATHYPMVNIPGFYFLRQHQERSYVVALKERKELSGMYYGIDERGLSLRSLGDILLLGGGGHRTGKCGAGMGYHFLKEKIHSTYPEAEVIAGWSAQDCMPHDGIPFIGNYSAWRPYWYVATGFHKWGMTASMVAAKIISDKICGISVPYEKTFSPQRFFLRAAFVNLMKDVGESVLGLGKGLFSSKERRCTHMGCRLEWNEEENTWECSCHGSGFNEKGELKDNPAKRNLR